MTKKKRSKAQIASSKKNLIPFKKGDPLINRKGRPKAFDELRSLAVEIANDKDKDKDGVESKQTRLENMLIAMSKSRNNADRALFLAYAYGKPPNKTEIEGEIKHQVSWKEFVKLGKKE